MKIFIDIDNTVLEHYGFYSPETESRIHKSIGKFPKENRSAIDAMYSSSVCRDPESVRKLFFLDNAYILTKSPIEEFELHKKIRVAEILDITLDELNNLKDSLGNNKYIDLPLNASKVDVVKEIFKTDSIEDYVLIDDYSGNIIEWEKHGGIGIKYFNEYNSPNHPTNGISISNFSVFGNLLDDCNLLLTGVNKLKLNIIATHLSNYGVGHHEVDLTEIIMNDMKQRFDVEEIADNSKVNLIDFMLQYYHFVMVNRPGYWGEKIIECLNFKHTYVVKSVFEVNTDNISSIINKTKKPAVTINILTSSKDRPSFVYDVYFTIDEKKLLKSTDGVFIKLVEVLNKLFLNCN